MELLWYFYENVGLAQTARVSMNFVDSTPGPASAVTRSRILVIDETSTVKETDSPIDMLLV